MLSVEKNKPVINNKVGGRELMRVNKNGAIHKDKMETQKYVTQPVQSVKVT